MNKNLYQVDKIEQETGKDLSKFKNRIRNRNNIYESKYKPNYKGYLNLLKLYDMQQNICKYKENNLPEGYYSYELERQFYFKGSLAVMEHDDMIYFCDYETRKSDNDGRPLLIQCKDFKGNKIGKLKVVNYNYELKDRNNDAVIIYDNIPLEEGNTISRSIINDTLLRDMARTLVKLNINLNVSNKKMIFKLQDNNQSNVLISQLREALDSDTPFIVTGENIEPTELGSTSDFMGENWFNILRNYDSLRCMISGIHTMTYGSNNADRIPAGSLDGQSEQVDIIYECGLQMRKLGFELVNKIFGTNITVEPYINREQTNVDKSIRDGIARNEVVENE